MKVQLSKVEILSQPANGTPSAGPSTILASYSGPPISAEVVVSQEAITTSSESIPPFALSMACGFESVTRRDEPRLGGWFRIEYGLGAYTQVRYVDMMSRRYFLGNVDSVRVSARRWRFTSPWPANATNSVRVSATVGQSQGGNYDEMVCSMERYIASGVAVANILSAPAGAYAVEVFAESLSGFNNQGVRTWGGTQPPLWIYGTESEQIYIDWANLTYVPQMRRLTERFGLTFSSNAVVLTAPMAIGARWYFSS